jgi:hypothetical protein
MRHARLVSIVVVAAAAVSAGNDRSPLDAVGRRPSVRTLLARRVDANGACRWHDRASGHHNANEMAQLRTGANATAANGTA